MADALPSRDQIEAALRAASHMHHEYEQVTLKGVRHAMWAGWYAAYVLGRLGDFMPASRLAALLDEVKANGEWAPAAADHVAASLIP